MRIVADENIVAVEENYRRFGELITLPGRAITAADVKHADALLVRSITRVNRQLLKGSSVRFVATATSGTDHIDLAWLRDAGITVVDAAGSNANAVMEYVFTALCYLIRHFGLSLEDRMAVVIGCGHVGSRVLRMLQAIGLECLVCDPPLEAALASGSPAVQQLPASGVRDLRFCSFEEALEADILTLHTPLVRDGSYPTRHLFDRHALAALNPGTLLINTGRGEVIDNTALRDRLIDGAPLATVLDVWEGEPLVNPELAQLVDIATPHFAGYSMEAKRAASDRNFYDFLRFFGLSTWAAPPALPPVNLLPHRDLHMLLEPDHPRASALINAVCEAFPLLALTEQFKQGADDVAAAAQFDQLRRELADRRELGLFAGSAA